MSAAEPKRLEIPGSAGRIVLCGGPYSNFAAVREFLRVTQAEEHRFCLGDMGGFGPHPDWTCDPLRESTVHCIQGNYDHAVGHGESDCGCGYLDPLDRKYSQLSFDYTLSKVSEVNRAWLRELPPQRLLHWGDSRILLCHGSPEEVNEFVWESETSDERIALWLKERRLDGICCTHSGLPWVRTLESGGFWLNVGVLGRPAHEGDRRVYYATVERREGRLEPRLRTLSYDPGPVVEEMRKEKLPEEFCQSLLEGVWTTCYRILPPAELPVRPRS